MKPKILIPPTYLILAIILQLTGYFLFPIVKIINFPVSLLGLLPLAISFILDQRAMREFKSAGTPVRPIQPARKLVVTGPYWFTRNPMYLGMMLDLLGVALLLGTLSAFIVPVGFWGLLKYKFILPEEKLMERQFGDAYRKYKNQVRRWL